MHDELAHLIMTKPKDVCVAIATICENFQPTDNNSIHNLYNTLSKADIKQHDHNIVKLANELKTAYLKLKQLGENMSENFLISCLLKGIPGDEHRIIRAFIKREKTGKTFEEIVAEIQDHGKK